jgi:predicted esterase
MAKQGKEALEKAGAQVTLVEYAGGHGWRGDMFGEMRKGVEWLEEKNAAGK